MATAEMIPATTAHDDNRAGRDRETGLFDQTSQLEPATVAPIARSTAGIGPSACLARRLPSSGLTPFPTSRRRSSSRCRRACAGNAADRQISTDDCPGDDHEYASGRVTSANLHHPFKHGRGQVDTCGAQPLATLRSDPGCTKPADHLAFLRDSEPLEAGRSPAW